MKDTHQIVKSILTLKLGVQLQLEVPHYIPSRGKIVPRNVIK